MTSTTTSSTSPSSRHSFQISKKRLGDTYKLDPKSGSVAGKPGSRLDVKARTSGKTPFMILFDGSKRISGSVQRATSSPTFQIAVSHNGKALDDANTRWVLMDHTGKKEASFAFELGDNEWKYLQWRGTHSLAVDGKNKPGAAAGGYKLVDINEPDGENVLAVFTRSRGFSKGGTLQVNVDWGTEFDQAAFLTFMCLFDHVSRTSTDGIQSAWSAPAIVNGGGNF